jgi:hypothetical protein
MSDRTTEVRCHDCGTRTEVLLEENGTVGGRTVHEFDLHCEACGAEREGRYRTGSGTIVWR